MKAEKPERNDLKLVGKIAAVRLRPGDVVIVKVKDHLSRDGAKSLEAYLKDYFPLNRILVLSGGISLQVAREES